MKRLAILACVLLAGCEVGYTPPVMPPAELVRVCDKPEGYLRAPVLVRVNGKLAMRYFNGFGDPVEDQPVAQGVSADEVCPLPPRPHVG